MIGSGTKLMQDKDAEPSVSNIYANLPFSFVVGNS